MVATLTPVFFVGYGVAAALALISQIIVSVMECRSNKPKAAVTQP